MQGKKKLHFEYFRVIQSCHQLFSTLFSVDNKCIPEQLQKESGLQCDTMLKHKHTDFGTPDFHWFLPTETTPMCTFCQCCEDGNVQHSTYKQHLQWPRLEMLHQTSTHWVDIFQLCGPQATDKFPIWPSVRHVLETPGLKFCHPL